MPIDNQIEDDIKASCQIIDVNQRLTYSPKHIVNSSSLCDTVWYTEPVLELFFAFYCTVITMSKSASKIPAIIHLEKSTFLLIFIESIKRPLKVFLGGVQNLIAVRVGFFPFLYTLITISNMATRHHLEILVRINDLKFY